MKYADAVVEALTAPIAVVGRDARIVDVNPAFARWCGTEVPQPIGRELRSVLDAIGVNVQVDLAISSGLDGQPSVSGARGLGLRLQSEPLILDDGEPGVLFEFLVTEAVEDSGSPQADSAERTSPRRSDLPHPERALGALPGGAFEVEFGGHEMTLSTQFVEYLGFPLQEGEEPPQGNQFVADRLHPDDLGRAIARILTPPETDFVEVDLRLRDATDRYRIFRNYSQVLSRLPDGTPLHIVGFFLDLDADLGELNETRERAQLLQSMVDGSEAGVILATSDGLITTVNHAATELFGLDAEQLEGTSIDDVLVLHDTTGKRIGSSVFWLSGVAERTVTGASLTVGDEHHSVIVDAGYQRSDAGVPIGLRFVIRSSEQELELIRRVDRGERMRSLGQLAEGMAHDFNNALAVIVTGAEVALSTVRRADLDLEVLASVEQALTRVTAAAELSAARALGLLDFGRSSAASEIRGVPVNSSIETAAELLRAGSVGDIDLVLGTDDDAVILLGGSSSLESIVLNMGINAENAGSKWLRITTAEVQVVEDSPWSDQCAPGSYIQVTIEDRGSGIAPEHLDKVFEPFFTTTPGGHGLGLSAVYGMVNDVGGAVGVSSEAGEGARFDLLLPQDDEHEAVVVTPYEPTTDLADVTIAVIDDDDSVRALVGSLLASVGWNVISFSTGLDAVEWLSNSDQAVDLAVVDFRMPVLDGGSTIREMRALRPELPAIILTGFIESVLDFDPVREQVAAILTKPFKTDELLGTISTTIQNARGLAESAGGDEARQQGP